MTDPIVSLSAPRRVAVFGGSNDPRKLGNFLLENLKRYGYEGDIVGWLDAVAVAKAIVFCIQQDSDTIIPEFHVLHRAEI